MNYNYFFLNMTHKEKRIFFNWLQRRGALKAYKAAKHKADSSWKPYEQIPIDEPFLDAFYWACTPQGSLYWEALCRQWYLHYEKL